MVLRYTISALWVIFPALLAAAQQGNAAPGVNEIVLRMITAERANVARNRAYTVKRDYQLLDKQEQLKAQLIASITYLPPDQKQYNIESSSGGIGGKVLRDIVQKETESPKEAQRQELSPQNYEFQLLGQEILDGRNCYVLSLSPKRDEKDLIRGKLWVDASDYRIHRLEGKPAKNPSWWIRDLQILMVFGSVDGMWLHTFTHAVADVRFKGKYVMESHDLEYRSATHLVPQHSRNPGFLAGAVINP